MDGADGNDGYSPSVTVTNITGGHRVTVTDTSGSTSFDIMDGADGNDGANGTSAYVHIRYSAVSPTSDSDMKTTPDDYIGIYSGVSSTAPTSFSQYSWYKIKGDAGQSAVSAVRLNGTDHSPDSNGTVDLGTVVTDVSGKLDTSLKGSANGLAELDSTGKVPSSQLPGFVDNIEEYPSVSSFPVTGSTNKIYVALDTNKNYRWSGSTYTELSKYDLATHTSSGLMSATDKQNLDKVVERTVNGKPADETGDYKVNDVEFAHQLVTPDAQKSSGAFLVRTTGGESSLSDGPAKLLSIQGRSVHTGNSEAVVTMTVTPASRTGGAVPIAATIDKDAFIASANGSGTYSFAYTTAWDVDPSAYGITVVGEPVDGDTISVVYVEEELGTIVFSDPDSFNSIGWNLYDHSKTYARVQKYSNTYGFRIDGTYTTLEYSETESGEKTGIAVTNGLFDVPGDGFVWVTGGNDTDTAVYMTWSDWTTGHDGDWEAYTEDEIDLSAAMAYFPYGLLCVGSIADEISLDMGQTISRIERMANTAENMAIVIASGKAYEADENYIYIVRSAPVINNITIADDFDAYDHGMELIAGGTVAPYVVTQYGQNLVDKLRHDVVVKSELLDMVYPVGSIYMSVASTSPATLFGGTWDRLKSRFLLGAEDTGDTTDDPYVAGNTGGAASQSYTPAGTNSGGSVGDHTLTTDEMPSHDHTFTGSAVTSGGISANHTHTTTTGNPSANHYHSGPSHTHTGPSHSHSGPNHSHSVSAWGTRTTAGGGDTSGTGIPPWGGGASGNLNMGTSCGNGGTGSTGSAGTGNTGSGGTGNTGTVSAWHTHTGTSGNQSAGHTHSVTASGSIGSTGGGGAHNHGFTDPAFTGTEAAIATMPPYLAVYMWKRTA